MDSRHRSIRALLKSMSPRRAEEYLKAFRLTPEEETYIFEREVNDLSCVQIANKYSTTVEVVKDRRRRGFSKIADHITHYGDPKT